MSSFPRLKRLGSWIHSFSDRPFRTLRRRQTIPRLEALEPRYAPAAFTVTTTADSGPGSLRQAILDADAAGGGTIGFQMPGGGAQTISPTSPLPIVGPNISIFGPSDLNHLPTIRLDGVNAGAGASGLVLTGGDSVIELSVTRFRTGILVFGGSGNTLQTDKLGTDAAGDANVGNTYAGLYLFDSTKNAVVAVNVGQTAVFFVGNEISHNGGYGVVVDGGGGDSFLGNLMESNGFAGVALLDGANGNVFGGFGPGFGGPSVTPLPNRIGGNGSYGVIVCGPRTTGNSFLFNSIGASFDGNGLAGVWLEQGASGNTFTADGVSSNTGFGFLFSDAGTTGNTIAGTFIGTVLSQGFNGGSNGFAGVGIGPGVSGNTIGGADSSSADVISGNGSYGVFVDGGSNNTFSNDRIGTSQDGATALPNGFAGVCLFDGAKGNSVSGSEMSGNGLYGAIVSGQGTSDSFNNDRIGVDAAGGKAVANGLAGVWVEQGASGNTFTGDTVSGNAGFGFLLTDAGTTENAIADSFIGTNPGGGAAVANGFAGIGIGPGARDNTVGARQDPFLGLGGNVISGNGDYGVFVDGGSNNSFTDDLIGTSGDGKSALPNGFAGVALFGGASGNNFQGFVDFADAITPIPEPDVISGNGDYGVILSGRGTTGNTFISDEIGVDVAGGKALANGLAGVWLEQGASDNSFGSLEFSMPGGSFSIQGVVSGNTGFGFLFTDVGTTGNTISGQLIGTNSAGKAAVPNGFVGVGVGSGVSGNTIGGSGANVISGNGSYGVLVAGGNGNLIEGNDIGVASDGATALANGNDGVFLTDGAANNTVSGNTIAFNKGDGVLIGSDGLLGVAAGAGNKVTQNSIFSNTQLGIDLGPDDGVTPNDSAGHTGPNNFQDFPVITSASSSVSTTTVSFTQTVAANVSYRVEFFVSPTADPSGFGQGKTFVGSAVVLSSTSGTFPEQASLTGNFQGLFLTATTTDASGDTSEFSKAVLVAGA
jgi:hypothetical protein